MTRLRTSLAVLLMALPCAGAWSSEQKGWALGTSGILTQMGGWSHDVLFDAEPSPTGEQSARNLLASGGFKRLQTGQSIQIVAPLARSSKN